MLTISLFIILAFLLARFVIGSVQRYLEGRARGRAFKRMLTQGRLEAGVYADALWSATTSGARKVRSRISNEQRNAILQARLEMREDFLDDTVPGLYQYIIIFLVSSVLKHKILFRFGSQYFHIRLNIPKQNYS